MSSFLSWIVLTLAPLALCQLGTAPVPTSAANGTTHPDVPPPPFSRSCTVNSLSSPHLRLSAVRYEPSHVEFVVYNPMNNLTTHCSAKYESLESMTIITGDCPNNAPERGGVATSTSFRFDKTSDGGTGRLEVNQTWTCDDDSAFNLDKRPYVGHGNVTVPATTQQQQEQHIWLTLSSPVKLKPATATPPLGHDTAGCAANSTAPSWIISDFDWRTGSWIGPSNPLSGGWVLSAFVLRMNITNPATNTTVSCTAFCPTGTINGNDPDYLLDPVFARYTIDWCTCGGLPPSDTNASYLTTTSIRLDGNRRRLAVAQTWYCDPSDTAGTSNPIQFSASGEVVLPAPLQCVPRPTTEPGFNIGSRPFIIPGPAPLSGGRTCGLPVSNFSVPGALTSQYTLQAPDALLLPKPVKQSCTVDSFGLLRNATGNIVFAVQYFAVGYLDDDEHRGTSWRNGSSVTLDVMARGLGGKIECKWSDRVADDVDGEDAVMRCSRWDGISLTGTGKGSDVPEMRYDLRKNVVKAAFKATGLAQLPPLDCTPPGSGISSPSWRDCHNVWQMPLNPAGVATFSLLEVTWGSVGGS
ncbi:hypothetical protein B0H63DRAFT_448271 [Podospora didyma]|uniref:Uncharacterized protein n=1 Tax=Podospora didyma TaxID=330526 RepID=A0AAE0NTN8_9PEZI|nr:hypothetical protein B0H63DRAFT_448271 [Podospora didyma]